MRPDQQSELSAIVERYSNGDGTHETGVPFLRLMRSGVAGTPVAAVFEPSLCLIVQGAKKAMLGSDMLSYAPGQYLAASVVLPTVGLVTEATPDRPYLCLQVCIDPLTMGELVASTRLVPAHMADTDRALFVGAADRTLADAVLRLARLLDTPADIPVLAPLVLKEIQYRLLAGPVGQRIAQVAFDGANMRRIAGVVQHLRADLAQPARIETLARMAGMSASSFHHHFKVVTAMSPVQFQKKMRLLEARRLMLADEADAARAAYAVGYDSTSQFSREYARQFGAPPIRDITALRTQAVKAA